ncbi:MAG: hypothetical protein VR65_22650 [Desulfobulbaceae bacterium BRH_c16a]|nr:MAG: hypothetical protein VR65_22650 [Desulfobulbaceae bacterium BRH_c16a]
MDGQDINKVFYYRTPESISTEIGGETVILNMKTGKYCGLNEVGTVVWEELEKQKKFDDLKSRILQEFNVSEEDCTAHLITFLNDMAANSLIEVKVEADR